MHTNIKEYMHTNIKEYMHTNIKVLLNQYANIIQKVNVTNPVLEN